MGIIYDLLAFIDWVIYSLASSMFRIIIDIANVEFFNVEQITTIANRIYIVVGVLMLFKLVISAVQYMINPDTFDDKEKGVAGILKKTAISLGLIVAVPAIFNFMVSIQGSIIKTLPSIILGTEPAESADYDKLGNDLSFTVLSSFVKVNENKGSNEITDIDSFKSKVTQGCPRLFGNVDDCKYNYMIIISTISGGFLCYVLLSMILDVAIRTIKFSIIRILAPIPISSYVFSKDKLNKFVKTTITVYTDLFIRLAIVYFIIFAIQNIVIESNLFKELAKDGGWFRETIIRIAIIFGLLMFAKTAPKFISELLGIPDIGAGDMKDMFKPAWQRAGLLGAAGGMLTAGAGNMINKAKFTNWKESSVRQNLKNAAKVLGSGAAGAASAGFHGGIAAAQGKNVKEVNTAGYKRAIKARQNRDLDKLNHVTWTDRTKARMADSLGIDTSASLAEGRQKAFSTLHQDVGNYKKAVMGRITKEAGNISIRNSTSTDSSMMELGRLLADNRTAIERSGNEGLMAAFNKFNMTENADGTVTCNGLRTGQNITYSELRAIGINAQEAGIGTISDRTREDGDITLLAQKELFSDAMKGEVMDGTGRSASKSVNAKMKQIVRDESGNPVRDARGNIKYEYVDNKDVHVDISTVIGQTRQHIAENAVNLGTFDDEFVVRYTDKDGNVVESTKEHPISGAENLQNAFETNFAKFDDSAQKKSAKISREMGSDTMAAARASLERRNANKDKK